MRTCVKCQHQKQEEEFSWKISGKKRQSMCKDCYKHYLHNHYIKNRQSYIKNAGKHRKLTIDQNVKRLLDYLLKHPCVDCGEKHPIVLHADHLRNKKNNISTMLYMGTSWNGILKELEKCEIRCANCHLKRTAKVFKWRKLLQFNNFGAIV